MRFFFVLLTAFLMSGAAALADGMVTAHVVDAHTGKSVPGQTVTLTNSVGDYAAITDKRGDAHFLSVPIGRSSLDATGGRYRSLCQPYFIVSTNQRRIVRVEVERSRGNVPPGPLCALSNLVNPGESADVYNIF